MIPPYKICRVYDQLQVQSLLLWTNGGPKAVHKLAMQMKQSQPEDWLFFAEWLLERVTIPKKAVLVPAPPRKWGHRDHAWGFAWALSQISGLPLRSPLVRVNASPQKDLSRMARAGIRIDVADPEWNCSDYRSVILIDDIVTTGSTAKACNIALGRPKSAVVWTLFDRMPCDAPSALL